MQVCRHERVGGERQERRHSAALYPQAHDGQVAFQYVDPDGEATLCAPYNPNGSSFAIEGIISRNGQILGKMGHTERYEENLFKNIGGNKVQNIFANAVNYFKKK